jgi:hypothetical protein
VGVLDDQRDRRQAGQLPERARVVHPTSAGGRIAGGDHILGCTLTTLAPRRSTASANLGLARNRLGRQQVGRVEDDIEALKLL